MEKVPKYKTEPIRHTLTPETEKRLLGNISPPKKKFIMTTKPPKIEHINHTMLPAPKAAENMSKLSSFQSFSKSFTNLENEIKELRMFSCPPSCDRIFDAVAEVRSNISIFENHCRTIAKQKKLKTEVSKKSFDFYKSFINSYQLFSDKIKIFGGQIHKLYEQAIVESFQAMDKNAERLFEVAYKDPQARSFASQFKKYCESSLKSIEDTLIEFIGDESFSAFGDEEMEQFAEKTKTFGRFFEKELSPAVAAALSSKYSIDRIIAEFRSNFTKIVPLITSAPKFIEQFKVCLEALEVTEKDILQVKKEIGDEKILKQRKTTTIVLPEEEEDTDDIMPGLNNLANLFKVTLNDEVPKSQMIASIFVEASTKMKEMKERIKKLESDLSIPPTTSKEEFKNQFAEMRRFKLDLEAKINEENAMLNRNIIYSIKSLIPNCTIDTSISYSRQVQSIVNQLRDFISRDKNKNEDLANEVASVKELLAKYYTPEDDESLQAIVEHSIDSLNNENKRLSNLLKEAKDEVSNSAQNLTNYIVSAFGVNESDIANKSINDLMNVIQNQINKVTNELRRSRSTSAAINAVLIKTRDELAQLLNVGAKGFDSEDISNDMDELISNLKTKRENSVLFQQNIYIFMNKLLKALEAPDFKVVQPTQEDINKTMQQLGFKLDDPHKLASDIMNSNPQNGLFCNAAAYKSLSLDLCSRLINRKQEMLEGGLINDLRSASFKKIDELEKCNAVKLFGELVQKNANDVSDDLYNMGLLKNEIKESRQNTVQLEETHHILQSMISQLSSEDIVLAPDSPQLIALNAFTAHLDKLKTNSNTVVNNIITDVSSLNSTICKHISTGKIVSKSQ